MYCIFCGAALPENAAFCHACGAEVTGGGEPEKVHLYSMRCSACGSGALKKIHIGEYRCEHCGTVLYTREQHSAADQEALDAKVAVLLSEAAAFEEKKDYDSQLQTLIKAAELAPENNTVLLRLGRAYWQIGSFEKAMEYYRIAEALYPNDPTVYNNIGSTFFKSGRYAEAYEQYKKAIAIVDSDSLSACAEDIAVFYGNYAYSLGKLGDKKNAKKYLSIAKEKGYSKESINRICEDLHLLRILI